MFLDYFALFLLFLVGWFLVGWLRQNYLQRPNPCDEAEVTFNLG